MLSEYGFFSDQEILILQTHFPLIVTEERIKKNKKKQEENLEINENIQEYLNDKERTRDMNKIQEDFIKSANDAFYNEFDGDFHEDML